MKFKPKRKSLLEQPKPEPEIDTDDSEVNPFKVPVSAHSQKLKLPGKNKDAVTKKLDYSFSDDDFCKEKLSWNLPSSSESLTKQKVGVRSGSLGKVESSQMDGTDSSSSSSSEESADDTHNQTVIERKPTVPATQSSSEDSSSSEEEVTQTKVQGRNTSIKPEVVENSDTSESSDTDHVIGSLVQDVVMRTNMPRFENDLQSEPVASPERRNTSIKSEVVENSDTSESSDTDHVIGSLVQDVVKRTNMLKLPAISAKANVQNLREDNISSSSSDSDSEESDKNPSQNARTVKAPQTPALGMSGLFMSPLTTPKTTEEKTSSSRKKQKGKNILSPRKRVIQESSSSESEEEVNKSHSQPRTTPKKEVRFETPPGYHLSKFEDMELYEEDMKNKELWLVKVPDDFTMSSLDFKEAVVGATVPLGIRNKQKNGVNNLLHSWHMTADKYREERECPFSVILPARFSKAPKCVGKFQGEISVTQKVSTKPSKFNDPKPKKHVIPQGLKMRNIPFGIGDESKTVNGNTSIRKRDRQKVSKPQPPHPSSQNHSQAATILVKKQKKAGDSLSQPSQEVVTVKQEAKQNEEISNTSAKKHKSKKKKHKENLPSDERSDTQPNVISQNERSNTQQNVVSQNVISQTMISQENSSVIGLESSSLATLSSKHKKKKKHKNHEKEMEVVENSVVKQEPEIKIPGSANHNINTAAVKQKIPVVIETQKSASKKKKKHKNKDRDLEINIKKEQMVPKSTSNSNSHTGIDKSSVHLVSDAKTAKKRKSEVLVNEGDILQSSLNEFVPVKKSKKKKHKHEKEKIVGL